MHPAQIVLYGSTLCVMITVHFSMKLLAEHVLNWKKPKEQNAIVIIILMAPLYAVDSYVGLINFFGSEAFFTFLDSIKECYEALVIAKFLGLMYSFLNISLSKNIVPDEIKGREIHHSFPMTLFQPHTTRLDHKTLKLLKNWTWQFVVIRPVCSILMITLQYLEVYPTWVSWTNTVILNISVSLALYSLVVFYHVFSKELEPHKPLAKFLCIKGIVFFCFWQYYGGVASLLQNPCRFGTSYLTDCQQMISWQRLATTLFPDAKCVIKIWRLLIIYFCAVLLRFSYGPGWSLCAAAASTDLMPCLF
ncbi:hypothetical protein AAZX31_06G235600 [Glycine max]|uniref:Transmembrane protein 184C n=2 Tax=Glycine subgen. Soja TaxID=1462606 RepID=K7KXA8_SOYBN|nr:transmembrane protein 184 homolog DDB_G0279555 isoform X2 [Glycine max]XP_028237770.1 transmembrane protein 184 homolog DDB_G0279555-like isoform X3 [Glycine soja]KAH1127559.1 hypothetical protein GYH30_016244 [Glycine max]KRH55411.1 hypothetical protein GLYMA_06G253700v4 [Glycine max]RZC09141.1 Transmembrane protein 184-like isoform B [Glycine soja]|eukprot:XP_025984762.1 transmembrane protein 184 homolog DDB_G0279555 isoform X3 [Glycine max]